MFLSLWTLLHFLFQLICHLYKTTTLFTAHAAFLGGSVWTLTVTSPAKMGIVFYRKNNTNKEDPRSQYSALNSSRDMVHKMVKVSSSLFVQWTFGARFTEGRWDGACTGLFKCTCSEQIQHLTDETIFCVQLWNWKLVRLEIGGTQPLVETANTVTTLMQWQTAVVRGALEELSSTNCMNHPSDGWEMIADIAVLALHVRDYASGAYCMNINIDRK